MKNGVKHGAVLSADADDIFLLSPTRDGLQEMVKLVMTLQHNIT